MSQETTSNNRPVWDIENSHPEIVEHVKTKLREVVDPEIGLDIIALGLVRNVRIEDGDANLYMILTTPFCPYGPAMIEMTRKKAEEALERPVTIELGMEMWDFSMMEEGAMPEWGMW
ncbi:MAG: iron-sulfur cluster assembly protein [Anaerolineales bacterium]|jgi:metal-sulfur cluster biosynthetic enzyme|nr:iron-sulfur cluster assembly protein [Anaerolineales bacterium]